MDVKQELEKRGVRYAHVPKVVRKRNGDKVDLDYRRIAQAVYAAAEEIGGHDQAESERVAIEVLKRLTDKRNGIPTVDEINQLVPNVLRDLGHASTAKQYENYARDRKQVREKLAIMGGSIKGATDGFLMVGSASTESEGGWNRERIIDSLLRDAGVDLTTAKKIAKRVENTVVLGKFPAITTDLIRQLVCTELLVRGHEDEFNRYKSFGIPAADLEGIIFGSNNENSNIAASNPESIAFSVSGRVSKAWALSNVFSRDVARAHTDGMVHLHDLDLINRVYCSAHSLEYLKKFGLNLLNLQTTSGPAKHTRTLTGHLGTFFASMQAYYAGALGVGYTNIFYAPHLLRDLEDKAKEQIDLLDRENARTAAYIEIEKREKRDVSTLERKLAQDKARAEEYRKNPRAVLTDEEIDKLMLQEAQHLIFMNSQSAFSRGGQTLFIDFNVHPGVPGYMKDTLAVEPGGHYAMTKNGRKVALVERRTEAKTPSGYQLMDLIDPETNRVVMSERLEEKLGRKELVQKWDLKEGEKPVTYGDYDWVAKRFAKSLLNVWERGDREGQPFAFPKCDFHVSEETFQDQEQAEIAEHAFRIASKNGAPYFIFDRDEVTLAACCRLKTTIDDNYVLKHPESIRFCGFQNVTVNLAQAALRATSKGKKNMEGLLEEVDAAMDIAFKAHDQKREYVERLMKKGGPLWQIGKDSEDGRPYVDLDKCTYIVGMIALNEAVQMITGKELHELNDKEFEKFGLRTIAHMNVRAKERGKQDGRKYSIEESPAESAARRFAKIDLQKYPEAKQFVRGSIEDDKIYWTNSVHLRADAPVDLVRRIEMQSLFHPAIESGAIIHAFTGEERPSPASIGNLVRKTYENTQCAQLTISPEFTVCKICHKTTPRLVDICPECGNKDRESLKPMSRIVGYYSYITNWNKSKLGELNARHAGDYSVENQRPSSVETPRVRGETGKVTAHIIGKTGCPTCTSLKGTVNSLFGRYAERAGIPLNVETHMADTEEGMARLMLAGVNPSQIPGLIITGVDGEIIYKGQTTYRNGKAALMHAGKLDPIMRSYFEARKTASG